MVQSPIKPHEVRARLCERISWGNMATSNLLKVGATTIELLVFNARRRACHFDAVMLAFSCDFREVCAVPARGAAVGGDSSWPQLSYIWLALASYQWFSWLNRIAATQLSAKYEGGRDRDEGEMGRRRSRKRLPNFTQDRFRPKNISYLWRR